MLSRTTSWNEDCVVVATHYTFLHESVISIWLSTPLISELFRASRCGGGISCTLEILKNRDLPEKLAEIPGQAF